MPDDARDLICLITRGTDHELSSVGLTMARGGTIWACTPCVKSRGYGQEDLLEGVVISGASVVHERIKTGAATLSF